MLHAQTRRDHTLAIVNLGSQGTVSLVLTSTNVEKALTTATSMPHAPTRLALIIAHASQAILATARPAHHLTHAGSATTATLMRFARSPGLGPIIAPAILDSTEMVIRAQILTNVLQVIAAALMPRVQTQ